MRRCWKCGRFVQRRTARTARWEWEELSGAVWNPSAGDAEGRRYGTWFARTFVAVREACKDHAGQFYGMPPE